MENLSSLLKEQQFFKNLKQDYLDIVLDFAVVRNFKKGEFIFREGQPAEYFYVIIDGLVAIDIALHSEHSITIQTVQEGQVLGWSWLVPPHRSRFNCRAMKDTKVIALDGKQLRQICETNHDFGYEFMKRFSDVINQRLVATRLQLINMYDMDEQKDSLPDRETVHPLR